MPNARHLSAVTVFCGSASGTDPAYEAAAIAMGKLLADRHIGLVFGGGSVGLMGVIANSVMANGGTATGVIPRHLWEQEVGHNELSELLVVDTMHERKKAMADRADAFIAMPGGAGTLEELFEVFTWNQIGLHDKPIGVLDIAGFYQPLLAFLDQARDHGFIRPANRAIIQDDPDPETLLDKLVASVP